MKVYLTKEIDETIADQIAFQINNTKDKEVELIVNSIGGEIIEGYNIILALNNFKGKTIGNINGLCASMAFPVILACDEIRIADHSLIMLHNPSSNVKDDKEAEILDKFKSSLMTIIKNKTNINIKELYDMMEEETWLNLEEFEKIVEGKMEYSVYKLNDNRNVTNKLLEIYNKINNINMKNEDIKDTEEETEEVTNSTDLKNELNEDEETSNNEVEEETENKEDETEDMEEVNAELEGEDSDEDSDDVNEIVKKLEEKIIKLEEELSKYKSEEEVKQEAKIENVLNLVKKRITEEEYKKWKDIGKTDFGFMKANIEKISTINFENNSKIENKVDEKFKNEVYDLSELGRKDPKKLKDLYKNHIDLYKKSFKHTYGAEFNPEK